MMVIDTGYQIRMKRHGSIFIGEVKCREMRDILRRGNCFVKIRSRITTSNLTGIFSVTKNICDALCDLVPFVQFKKREKHSKRSVTFRLY